MPTRQQQTKKKQKNGSQGFWEQGLAGLPKAEACRMVGVRAMKSVFSLFDMDAILRKTGAERVGEDASMKLSELLEDSGKEIVFKARQLSYHAGRRHVTRDDIVLAAQYFRN